VKQKKESNDKTPMSPISKNAIRSLIKSSVDNGTQISDDAVELLRGLLTEHAKWIAMEAERMSKYAGQKRITNKEIGDAVAAYFGSMKGG